MQSPRETEDKKSASRSREAVLQSRDADITASLLFVPEDQGIDKSAMVRLSSADDRNCARA